MIIAAPDVGGVDGRVRPHGGLRLGQAGEGAIGAGSVGRGELAGPGILAVGRDVEGRAGRRRRGGRDWKIRRRGTDHQRAVPPQAFLPGHHVPAVQRALVVGHGAVGGGVAATVDGDRVDDQAAVLPVDDGVVVVLDLHLVGGAGGQGRGEGEILGSGADGALAHRHPIDQQLEMRVRAAGRKPLRVDDDLRPGAGGRHGRCPRPNGFDGASMDRRRGIFV